DDCQAAPRSPGRDVRRKPRVIRLLHQGTQEHVDRECTHFWLLCRHRPYRGLATQSGLLVLQSLMGSTHPQASFTSSQRQICPEGQPWVQPDSHMTGMVVVVVIEPVALTTR